MPSGTHAYSVGAAENSGTRLTTSGISDDSGPKGTSRDSVKARSCRCKRNTAVVGSGEDGRHDETCIDLSEAFEAAALPRRRSHDKWIKTLPLLEHEGTWLGVPPRDNGEGKLYPR